VFVKRERERGDSSGGSVEVTGRDTAAESIIFLTTSSSEGIELQGEQIVCLRESSIQNRVLDFSKFWIDAGSVVDFFVYHMEKDNWKLLNSFRGSESILNFSKPEKTCSIKVVDKWYGSVEVEIRVGPLGQRRCRRCKEWNLS